MGKYSSVVVSGSLSFLISFSAFAEDFPTFKVGVPSLRVWDSIGASQVCSLVDGAEVQPIGRDEKTELIQVKITRGGSRRSACPDVGYVDPRYIWAKKENMDQFEDSKVDLGPLSLRSEPKVGGKTYQCGLPVGSELKIQPEKYSGSTTTWLKVKTKNPIKGCPEEGWVAAAYLAPINKFSDLPVYKADKRLKTETNCPMCRETARADADAPGGVDNQDKELRAMANSGRDVKEPGDSPWTQTLKSMIKNESSCKPDTGFSCSKRGLIQMPGIGKTAAFCGTQKYLGPGEKLDYRDAFASPSTACAFTAMAQEWKKTTCPTTSGCTIRWGDISLAESRRFPPHASHPTGDCIDFRPMSKGDEFDPSPTFMTDGDYDREATRKFIELAKKYGATTVLFSDPGAGGTVPGRGGKRKGKKGGGGKLYNAHKSHLHICFNNRKEAAKSCDNLKIDPQTCPELQ